MQRLNERQQINNDRLELEKLTRSRELKLRRPIRRVGVLGNEQGRLRSRPRMRMRRTRTMIR
jgi:hypothetical protein